jgi:hypothetical protein
MNFRLLTEVTSHLHDSNFEFVGSYIDRQLRLVSYTIYLEDSTSNVTCRYGEGAPLA